MLVRLRTLLHQLNHSKALTTSLPSNLNHPQSIMSTEHKHSAACCTIPPVISEGYKEKGEYKEFAGLNTYFTGPTDTGKTIIIYYDIFGYFPQTVQGIDMLAASTCSLVLMPDFFRGKYMDVSVYPPKNDEDRKAIANFIQTTANFQDRLKETESIVEALKKDGRTKLGVMGYCWGGKMATLAGATGNFEAIASIHPAAVNANDAERLKAPIAMYVSKDEDEAECKKFMDILASKPLAAKNEYKCYGTMVHGWAAARADLKDPERLKEYEDVYGKLAAFFSANMS
ncbi:hypothetical protein FRB95_003757 [Tulasnella sp. JGI-2019a]|nr:hypothetical protein FRB95_003757 [Tulasnella sp. JGI-2019a]